MSFWSAALGPIASLTGGIVGAFTNANQAKKSRSAQARLAEYQNEKNIEMWKMQNEYNLPKNQMQRFKDAGLNPNLIYGKGDAGNASSIAPYQAFDPKYPQFDFNVSNPLQSLGMYQDFQNKKVVHDNLGKQGEAIDVQNAYNTIKSLNTMARTELTKKEVKWIDQIKSMTLSDLKTKIQLNSTKNNMMSKDWENYKKYGIRPQDGIWWRQAAQWKEAIQGWVKSAKDKQTFKYPKSWQK